MMKRLMLVAMALGTLVAFAAPAIASAATGELTHVGGKPLAPGASLTVDGEIGGFQTFGKWDCSVTFQGVVSKNNAEGSITVLKSSSTEDCRYTTPTEYPITFTNLKGTLRFGSLSRLELSGSETGLPGPFSECELAENAFVPASYTPGSTTFEIGGPVTLKSGHTNCNNAVFGTVGNFSLTSGSDPVVVN